MQHIKQQATRLEAGVRAVIIAHVVVVVAAAATGAVLFAESAHERGKLAGPDYARPAAIGCPCSHCRVRRRTEPLRRCRRNRRVRRAGRPHKPARLAQALQQRDYGVRLVGGGDARGGERGERTQSGALSARKERHQRAVRRCQAATVREAAVQVVRSARKEGQE